jgi:CheY-like chemotaxis protein
MGLAIAYGTVRRHGGTIEVRSEPGHGAVVALKLPQHRLIETTPAISAAPPPRLRALIIDDDPWSCHVTFNYLANRKDSVETAESGGQGIAKLRQERFDLVVTDRAMPDMSGDEVARVAKEIHPETRVIMVTGFGDIMLDGGEYPPGVDLILSKPITEYDLLTAISRVFAPKPTP